MATVPTWAASTAYALGANVVRLTQPAAVRVPVAIGNPGFESGDTGWDKGSGWLIDVGTAFQGSWRGYIANNNISRQITSQTEADVEPGDEINAKCKFYRVNDSGIVLTECRVALEWRDAAHAALSVSYGDNVTENEHDEDAWLEATVTANAPANAAYAVVLAEVTVQSFFGGTGYVLVDDFSWDATVLSYQPTLMYEATVGGVSGAVEPTWPMVLGGTVVDGTVTWTAVAANRVVWKARSLLRSGATEPAWPTVVGGLVADNTIQWRTISKRVEDENCPNTREVAISDEKVFAANGEIVNYCVTTNPLDWTTPEDAGYIGSGLQQGASKLTTMLGTYRGNLAIFSNSTFLLYQTDPDPNNISKLDSQEGIGSIYHRTFQSVGNDGYYLTPQGVRSISISVGSTNMQSNDIGAPVDSLVQAALAQAIVDGYEPWATYFPNLGQYWLVLGAQVFVYTLGAGTIGRWSRYVFPWPLTYASQLAGNMYVRHGDIVSRVSEAIEYDEVLVDDVATPQYFDSVVQWPWLDWGSMGTLKMMHGFDLVATGGVPSIQFGYDQSNEAALTDAYVIEADTIPGDGIVPFPMTAASFSLKITFTGGAGRFRQHNAANLYVEDGPP
jgi:hypothetical protein